METVEAKVKTTTALRGAEFLIKESTANDVFIPEELTEEQQEDIHKIVDTFKNQLQTSKYSRLIPVSEIAAPKNDYNLNIPRYIDSQDRQDIQDIDAHLFGGIPERDIISLQ